MQEPFEAIDAVRLNFSEGSLKILNISLAFIMFGVALGIKIERFKNIIYNPKSVFLGIAAQFFLLPAITLLLILIIKPSPSIALGMILVAACPGGNISNFITALAKGNAALSVTLTAISDLSAIIMTPLNFAFWGSLYYAASDIIKPITINPLEMFKTVFIILGIPLCIGLWFAHRFPKITKKITFPIKILSIIIFFGYIVAAFASNFDNFLRYIHLVILIVLIHNALALASGFGLSKIFRLNQIDTRCITIETGIQNSGLALVLIWNPNLFDGLGGMAIIAAWWGLWHIVAGLGIASFWSRRPIKE